MSENPPVETTPAAAVEPVEPVAQETAPEVDPPGAEALGDPGKKALDTMKAEKREALARARELETQLAELTAKAEGREAEFKAAQDAQRVKDEAIAAANERILRAEVRAAAASKLADPADALRFIDLSDFEVGSDGDVDASAISAAIDSLVTSKPYLAAQSGRRFQGTADGGARNDAAKPSQLTQADLARMSPEAIVAAKREGRLNDLMGINP